jgi:hypothetical protein
MKTLMLENTQKRETRIHYLRKLVFATLAAAVAIPMLSILLFGGINVWTVGISGFAAFPLVIWLPALIFFIRYAPPGAPSPDSNCFMNKDTGELIITDGRLTETHSAASDRTLVAYTPAGDRDALNPARRAMSESIFLEKYTPAIDYSGDELEKYLRSTNPVSFPVMASAGCLSIWIILLGVPYRYC